MSRTPDKVYRAERLARLPLARLFAELATSPSGLSSESAAERLRTVGHNTLPEAKKQPLSRKAAGQFKNLFNVLLIVAAALSFMNGWLSEDLSSVQMGIAILLVVVVSVLFSLFQEHRAERAIEALRQLVPDNIKVVRDGKTVQISSSLIAPGDVISLEEGDKIPADARLLSSFQFSTDDSVLTGESEPQPRGTCCQSSEDCAPEDMANMVFAGTTVASGSGTAVVLATGMSTRFGQVVGIAHEIQEPLSPLQKEIDYTARLNFTAAVLIGLLFLVIAYEFLNLSISESLLFMIGVMVCLVPEGLQVTLTLSLAISSLMMSKRNVVVKRLSSVETLGSTTVICTDKTGTITEGQMTVRKVWLGGTILDVTGEGYEPEGGIFAGGQELKASTRTDIRMLCEVAALDNRATIVPPLDRRKYRWTAIGDSTDAALLVLATKAGIDAKRLLEENPRVGMIPFDSTRKMMTSIHRNKEGLITAYVKGAGNELLSRCQSALWGGEVVQMTEERLGSIRKQIDAFARDAYRVIALAVRPLSDASIPFESASVEARLMFVGLVAILDPPRRDVAQAVVKARSAGIKIVMMTGDHALTAEAIARKVGIISSQDHVVLSCERLSEKSDAELSTLLDSPEVVLARVAPEEKLRVVRILQEKGEIVAVTGDGVNDAPALLEADIGIAMGITGTDVARESADMVLLDDDFSSIVSGVEVGRSVFDNLKKFIVYVFSHNWAELMTFIVFVLLNTPLPLAVIGVLTIDLLLEIPPSIALTIEPPEPGIMGRPPRSRKSRLFDVGTLARSFCIGSLIGMVAVFWCFQAWADSGWSLGMQTVDDETAYLTGTTVVIVAIMAGQVGNLFATRTSVRSFLSVSPAKNRWLLPSLVAMFVMLLAIVYLPVLQPIFGTMPLEPITWIYLFSIAPVILLLEEARKLVVRNVILPVPTVPVPAPVPITAAGMSDKSLVRRLSQHGQSLEIGSPIILLKLAGINAASALPVAMSLAEDVGSKVLVASDAALPNHEKDFLLSETEARTEYVGLNIEEGAKGPRQASRSIGQYADRTGVEMIVAAVPKEVFSGHGRSGTLRWINELSGKRVVLVSSPPGRSSLPRRPSRLLIPVLDEFHPEVFALAGALTARSRVPDVDVVAAKVVRMPPTVPLYSTYRPESLVDAERELSFLSAFRGLPLLRRLGSRVLLVRDVSRDLVTFAEERRVDMILLRGDWSAGQHGFLGKKEREIAERANCSIAVLLPAVS